MAMMCPRCGEKVRIHVRPWNLRWLWISVVVLAAGYYPVIVWRTAGENRTLWNLLGAAWDTLWVYAQIAIALVMFFYLLGSIFRWAVNMDVELDPNAWRCQGVSEEARKHNEALSQAKRLQRESFGDVMITCPNCGTFQFKSE